MSIIRHVLINKKPGTLVFDDTRTGHVPWTYAHKQFKTMEKLHGNQTADALEKAGSELDCLVRLTNRDE